MVTRYKYFEKFYELLKRNPHLSHHDIWEMTEDWVIQQIGVNKYSTFGSFRNAKVWFDANCRLTK